MRTRLVFATNIRHRQLKAEGFVKKTENDVQDVLDHAQNAVQEIHVLSPYRLVEH